MKAKLLILFLFLVNVLHAQEALLSIQKDEIHPRTRLEVYPNNESVVQQNPIGFLWPTIELKGVTYDIQIAQDVNFKSKLISKTNLPWAIYNTHSRLESGKWYWKYTAKKSGGVLFSSPVYTFEVPESAKSITSPTAEEFIAKVSSLKHPRVFFPSNELTDFRTRNAGSADAVKVIEEAKKQLNAPLIVEAPTRPRDTTNVEGFEKKVLLRFMYHRFGEVVRQPIESMSLAYLLTGNKAYATDALRQALSIAKMDPKGPATQEDFNSASVMLAMATAYDVAYNYMAPSEKEILKKAIKVRGDYFFRHYVNKFEAQSMDNHVWQHTLRRFFMTAIAMVGEIDEASQWLTYIYEVWTSRFPIIGGNDGGWHDGSSYYAVNFETFIMMPLLLKNLTGTDFFDLDWYKNAGSFLAYSFPKNSYSTGFGDSFETMLKPSAKYISYADALARETGSSVARAYANHLVNGDLDKINKDKDFRLYRLLTKTVNKDSSTTNLENMPQAGYFPDAGFALMHTKLAHTRRNLMVSFFSIPFGATGHAHAAHNGFTISYGGKQLFGGSGYYSNFNDPHTLMHYRTRGHNTILADNKSMVIGENGYGWLPRFYNNDEFTYVVGDASHAFGDMTSKFWIDRMEMSKVDYEAKNGFGNPGVTKFRRHFVLLRPNVIVIYDDLEAESPISWSLLLHSNQELKKTTEINIVGENEFANSNVHVFSSNNDISSEITDEFFSPAINWKKKPVNGSLEYPNNWHSSFNTTHKTKNMRFLTIITVDEKGKKTTEVISKKNLIKVSGWTIDAELDLNKASSLKVYKKNKDGIYFGDDIANKELEQATVIINNGKVDQVLVDKLPNYR